MRLSDVVCTGLAQAGDNPRFVDSVLHAHREHDAAGSGFCAVQWIGMIFQTGQGGRQRSQIGARPGGDKGDHRPSDRSDGACGKPCCNTCTQRRATGAIRIGCFMIGHVGARVLPSGKVSAMQNPMPQIDAVSAADALNAVRIAESRHRRLVETAPDQILLLRTAGSRCGRRLCCKTLKAVRLGRSMNFQIQVLDPLGANTPSRPAFAGDGMYDLGPRFSASHRNIPGPTSGSSSKAQVDSGDPVLLDLRFDIADD